MTWLRILYTEANCVFDCRNAMSSGRVNHVAPVSAWILNALVGVRGGQNGCGLVTSRTVGHLANRLLGQTFSGEIQGSNHGKTYPRRPHPWATKNSKKTHPNTSYLAGKSTRIHYEHNIRPEGPKGATQLISSFPLGRPSLHVLPNNG